MSPTDSDTFWVVAAPSPNFDNIPTINVATFEVPLPAYWRILDLLAEGKPEAEIVKVVMHHTGTKTAHVVTEIVDSVAENQRLIRVGRRSSNKPSSRLSVVSLSASRARSSSSFSVYWKTPPTPTTTKPKPSSIGSPKPGLQAKEKPVSEYRAARIEARRDLEAAEARLAAAQQTEKELLHDALVLARRKEQLALIGAEKEEEGNKEARQQRRQSSTQTETTTSPYADDGHSQRRRTAAAIEKEMKQVLQRHHDVEAEIRFAKRLTVIHKASLA